MPGKFVRSLRANWSLRCLSRLVVNVLATRPRASDGAFSVPSVSFVSSRPRGPRDLRRRPESARRASSRARRRTSYEPTDRVSQLQNEGAYAVQPLRPSSSARAATSCTSRSASQVPVPREHVARRAWTRSAAGRQKYSSPDGTPALAARRAADYVTRTRDVPVTPDEVVVGPGARPGLFFPTLALVQPGDEVIYPAAGSPPGQTPSNQVRRRRGARPVPLRPDGASFDMDAFRAAITPATKLIVLNSPANPTGRVMPSGDVEEVASIGATENDAWVLTDEIYSRLVYPAEDGTPGSATSVFSIPGMRDRTVLVDGFSKTYCATGWRLGWAVMPSGGRAARSCSWCTLRWAAPRSSRKRDSPRSWDRRRGSTPWWRATSEDFVVGALNEKDDTQGVSCPVPEGAFYAFPDVSSFGARPRRWRTGC